MRWTLLSKNINKAGPRWDCVASTNHTQEIISFVRTFCRDWSYGRRRVMTQFKVIHKLHPRIYFLDTPWRSWNQSPESDRIRQIDAVKYAHNAALMR